MQVKSKKERRRLIGVRNEQDLSKSLKKNEETLDQSFESESLDQVSPISIERFQYYNITSQAPISQPFPIRKSRVQYRTDLNNPFNFPIVSDNNIADVALTIDNLPPIAPPIHQSDNLTIPIDFPPSLPPLSKNTVCSGDPVELKEFLNLKLCHQLWDNALQQYRVYEAENNKEAMAEVCRQLNIDISKVRPISKSSISSSSPTKEISIIKDQQDITIQLSNLGKLTLVEKATLLNNIFKLNSYLQDDILSIISSVDIKDFRKFRTAVDNISDYYNVFNLYYRVLSDTGKKLFKEKMSHSDELGRIRPVKVISDLDDTLVCSGGTAGNVDTRYPKDIIYPGITTFYKELDMGISESDGSWPKDRHGNLVFASARPRVKGTTQVEMITYRSFKSYFDNNKLHCYPTLLTGNMKGITGAVQKNFTEMAIKKSSNIIRYMELYPEYDLIFLGDNGQGDPLACLSMEGTLQSRLKMAIIHRVQDEKKTFGVTSPTEKILFFDNYVAAASEAYLRSLITVSGLMRVVTAAKKEFETIPWVNEQQRKKTSDIFYKDCEKAEWIIDFSQFVKD